MSKSVVLCAMMAMVLLYGAMHSSPAAAESHSAAVKPSVQAQSRYRQAVQALRKNNHTSARTLLEQIVRAEPEVSQYHYALSMAYSGLGDYHKTWQQLCETLKHNPRHKEAGRDIMLLWQLLSEQGLFDVGVAGSEVRSMLGEPDHIRYGTHWQGWRYSFWLIEIVDDNVQRVLDIRGMDPQHLLLVDNVAFFVDARNWRALRRSGNRHYLRTDYFPQQQQSDEPRYRELFSVRHLLGAAVQPLHLLLEAEHRRLLANDPDGDWRILEHQPEAVSYEWYGKTSGRYIVSRLLTGARDVHQLTYSTDSAQAVAGIRDQWTALLNRARLTGRQPDIFYPDSMTYLK